MLLIGRKGCRLSGGDIVGKTKSRVIYDRSDFVFENFVVTRYIVSTVIIFEYIIPEDRILVLESIVFRCIAMWWIIPER